MKSEKGVTLTSIMIYVIALTVIVIALGRITTYFYKNIKEVKADTNASVEYTKFNSYFTNDINTQGNRVIECTKEYIVFSKTRSQYTYKNKCIYVNKSKICENIELCEFNYDENTRQINVTLNIQGKDYSTLYTIAQ